MLTAFAVTALCGFLVSSHPIHPPSFNCSFPIAPTCESVPLHSIERRGMSAGMSASSAKGGSSGKGSSARFTFAVSTQTSLLTSTVSTDTLTPVPSGVPTQPPTQTPMRPPTQPPTQLPSQPPMLAPTFAAGPPTRAPITNADSPLANLKDKSADDSSATLYLFIVLIGLIILVLFLTCLKIRRDRQNAHTAKDVELIVANKIITNSVDNEKFYNDYLEPVVNNDYDLPGELAGVTDLYELAQEPPESPVMYSVAS